MPLKRPGFRVHAKRWEQEIQATLFCEVEGGEHGIRRAYVLPFLPRQGDELAVGFDGDYMTVECVFWCPDEGLTVQFEDEPLRTLEEMKRWGWVEEVIPAPSVS